MWLQILNIISDFVLNLTVKKALFVCFILLPLIFYLFWFVFDILTSIINFIYYQLVLNKKNIIKKIKLSIKYTTFIYKFLYFGVLIPFCSINSIFFKSNEQSLKVIISTIILGLPYVFIFIRISKKVYSSLLEGCTIKMNAFSNDISRYKRRILKYVMSIFLLPIIGIVFLFLPFIIINEIFVVYSELIKKIFIKNKIIIKESDNNIKLYKYLSVQIFDKYSKDYLNGKLYFSERSNLNDPLENISMVNRTSVKSKDNNYWDNDPLEKFKICSMTTNPNNYVMWSHYASNHTGVCLEIEIEKNFLTNQKIKLEKVIYSKQLPIINDFVYPDDFINENYSWTDIKKMLFYKLNTWSYEDEWRLVIKSDEAKTFQIGRVTKIICGYKSIPESIQSLMKTKKIPIEQISLRRTEKEGLFFYSDFEINESIGEFSNETWKYSVSDNAVTILKYYGYSNEIEIPQKFMGKFVTNIGENAFANNKKIKSVFFPSELNIIESLAFSGCSKLKSIHFNKKLKVIGKMSFRDCDNLESITLPTSIERICKCAFEQCNKLSSLTILGNVYIENKAFINCEQLLTVKMGSNVKNIGNQAFYGCKMLNSFEVDGTIDFFGRHVFSSYNLSILRIKSNNKYNYKDGVVFEKDNKRLFFCSNDISKLFIPHNTSVIKFSALEVCKNLTEIIVDKNNKTYACINGVLYDKKQKKVLFYPRAKTGNYIIPEGVFTIGYASFSNCEGLTSIRISKSVKKICHYAFADCYNLATISPNNIKLKYVGIDVFDNCFNLQNTPVYTKRKQNIFELVVMYCKAWLDNI